MPFHESENNNNNKKIIFPSISLSEKCFQDYCSKSTSRAPTTASNTSPASAHFILVITCEVDIISSLLEVDIKAHRIYAAHVA